ncbi:MAG TPA: thiosulfate oxidation carrier complex protein SoxZ [Rhodocyclaceae bacterium]|nr:MAG: thiosulfate oxidation carrier complex protein SoxZ [Betaproteobacteria bacterium CG2_30_68_42]PIV71739.1 MAG: thiosulfate oxidation carrier complex protein SoxZ [Rhodocyclales bacterium CG17_big_fil_post_rev_8_21_14_2_50_68_7]PIX75382.1 MAG: thiosulfate oxidation carrier complex protein SoxZ [Rhodocyclales bacterium CG_4_10_14_3_um_filter_68_10]PJA57802.1 MAG: thiosulfate oxidation carrier complex protein SoxZ [Rhodocyclales bacterium CG_4_9_14_3_um_filter_68_10]HCX33875.1 thiosulfate o
MADPMKIRARLKGDTADIRVLMSHPMETGQRKDAAGKLVPAHYIQNISITLAGKTVVEGQLNTAVSRNPVFGFKVKGAKAGDKVVIHWVDTNGDQRTDETTVTAG